MGPQTQIYKHPYPYNVFIVSFSDKMNRGPSPLIPVILVGALSLLTLGPQLLEGWSLISDLQESWLVPVFILPITLVFLIFLVKEIIVVLFVLTLVAFVFREALLLPLVMVLVIVLLSVYFSTHSRYLRYGVKDDNAEGWFGLGGFMLVMVFLIASSLFCEECYWWISLMLVFPFVYFFSVS